MTPPLDPRATIRRLNLVGGAAMVVALGGMGGWASTTHISGAVIANATVVVETSVKKVQHLTGGIVKEILVKDGSEVEAGQLLLRLDDTVTRATLGVVQSQLDLYTAREARLLAERDGRDAVVVPAAPHAGSVRPISETALATGNAAVCVNGSRRSTRKSAASSRSSGQRTARSSLSARNWRASPSSTPRTWCRWRG
jgi:multidrug efflux pump subunit AcrA (membrane-fusion protein)